MAYYMSPQGPRRMGSFKAAVFKTMGIKIPWVSKPTGAWKGPAADTAMAKAYRSKFYGNTTGKSTGGKPGKKPAAKKAAPTKAEAKSAQFNKKWAAGVALKGTYVAPKKTTTVKAPKETVPRKVVARVSTRIKQKAANRSAGIRT